MIIFLPVRKGSERVKEKNTRRFGDLEGGLLELKLSQLITLKDVDEILVSTNDDKCWDICLRFQKLSDKLRVVKRPDELSSSQTSLSDLILYIPEVTSAQEILWTHVTSPFCDSKMYSDSIKMYQKVKNAGFDSLISGCKFQDFLLDRSSNNLVNNSTELVWPRTQDLNDWFLINNAVFIGSRQDYLNGNRIGRHPFLMDFNKIQSLDVDDEEDFKIAQAVYERVIK